MQCETNRLNFTVNCSKLLTALRENFHRNNSVLLTLNNYIRIKVDKLALEMREYVIDKNFGIMWFSWWHLGWVRLHSEASGAQLGLRHPLATVTQKKTFS